MGQPRYPKAVWAGNGGYKADGLGYGPLPDVSRGALVSQMRVVAHTTESAHLPSYNMGRFAPHLTYNPTDRTWLQHVEHHRRTGTMLGQSRTGVLGNEFSVQFEIRAYSDREKANEHGGLWVGDFTDDHYADLADYLRWCRTNLFDGHLPLRKAYGPAADFDSFRYGRGDRNEMSKQEWLDAGGIFTAHGAGPNQAHWDTGVLDLHRVIRESLPRHTAMIIGDQTDSVVPVSPVDRLRQAESLLKTALLLIQEERTP